MVLLLYFEVVGTCILFEQILVRGKRVCMAACMRIVTDWRYPFTVTVTELMDMVIQ